MEQTRQPRIKSTHLQMLDRVHNRNSVCVCVCVCMCTHARVCMLSCSVMFDPLGSSVHGVFQKRILEWVAISFFRGYSQNRDRTYVSCVFTGRQVLYHCATWEALGKG